MAGRVTAAAALGVSVTAVVTAAVVRTLPGADATRVVEGNGTDLAAGALAVAWTATGAVLALLRPRNALGWLLVVVGVCQSLQQGLAAYGGYAVATGNGWPGATWVAWVSVPLWLPGLLPLLTLLPALYPDGHLAGRTARLAAGTAAAGIVLVSLGFLLAPDAYDDIAPGPSPLAAPDVAVLALLAGAACLATGTLAIWVGAGLRLARAGSPERQQLAWLLLAVVPFSAVFFADVPNGVGVAAGLLVPLAVAVGVLRYRLLGIEVVLRRGLVYGALTAVVVAVYLAVTAVAGARLDRGPLPGVVTAALVVVGLAPLRDRVQAAVDRLVYGDRGDPLRAVARLGDRVAAARGPELLPAVLATVADAVRAGGAAVLAPDGSVVAVHGRGAEPVPDPAAQVAEELPLRVGGQHLGVLRVVRAAPGERLARSDRRVLEALAPHVAAVVRALDLAEELEAERDRVVAAAQRERERLRRDLHDGLGPSLSGVALGLQALDDARLRGDDPAALALSTRIREEVAGAVGEVRRIIDDLRPAVLDEVRLAEAVRRHAAALSCGDSLEVRVDAGQLPALPAELEAAAYRIVREALTNVVRHAGARRVEVSLGQVDGAVRLQVADDGHGLGGSAGSGLGLASMRHRATELGGRVDVASDDRGTTVVATLPLAGAS